MYIQEIKDSLLNIKKDPDNIGLDHIWPGQDLFALFCKFGCYHASHNSAPDPNDENIKSIAQLVADIQDWLLLFLNLYSDVIDLQDEYMLTLLFNLETRSGVQFLFDLFKDVRVIYPGGSYYGVANHIAPGTEVELGKIFQDLLDKLDNFEEFDFVLKIAMDLVDNKDAIVIPEHMPPTHIWWSFYSE